MRLGLYLNSLARLRNPDSACEPEPAVIAALAMSFGAQLILAGWIPSGGLLTERDIRLIREVVHGDLIIVTPLDGGLVESVVKLHPEGVMIVASGWDGIRDFRPIQMEVNADEIGLVAAEYKTAGVQPSVLIEPDADSVKATARKGLSGVTLDASLYAAARTDEDAQSALDKLADAALASHKFGLVTAVGHGLTYQNVGPVAALRYVEELYVGRSIIVRAIMNGMDRAIGDIMNAIDRNCPR